MLCSVCSNYPKGSRLFGNHYPHLIGPESCRTDVFRQVVVHGAPTVYYVDLVHVRRVVEGSQEEDFHDYLNNNWNFIIIFVFHQDRSVHRTELALKFVTSSHQNQTVEGRSDCDENTHCLRCESQREHNWRQHCEVVRRPFGTLPHVLQKKQKERGEDYDDVRACQCEQVAEMNFLIIWNQSSISLVSASGTLRLKHSSFYSQTKTSL